MRWHCVVPKGRNLSYCPCPFCPPFLHSLMVILELTWAQPGNEMDSLTALLLRCHPATWCLLVWHLVIREDTCQRPRVTAKFGSGLTFITILERTQPFSLFNSCPFLDISKHSDFLKMFFNLLRSTIALLYCLTAYRDNTIPCWPCILSCILFLLIIQSVSLCHVSQNVTFN